MAGEAKVPGGTGYRLLRYMTFITSKLKNKLETPGFLQPGLALFGDQAYVSNGYMVTPYRNAHSGINDDFNFFQSQVRIRIEMAFGVLTRRWALLQTALPARLGMVRQIALVSCCVKLHNFCLERSDSQRVSSSLPKDNASLHSLGCSVFSLDPEHGVQTNDSLADVGHHTDDSAELFRAEINSRVDFIRNKLRASVEEQGLTRPV